jgi:hypothetical protein
MISFGGNIKYLNAARPMQSFIAVTTIQYDSDVMQHTTWNIPDFSIP